MISAQRADPWDLKTTPGKGEGNPLYGHECPLPSFLRAGPLPLENGAPWALVPASELDGGGRKQRAKSHFRTKGFLLEKSANTSFLSFLFSTNKKTKVRLPS